MPRPLLAPALALLLLPGCIGSSYSPMDQDGDGLSPLDGDCWDAPEGPPGSGISGADIHPGAVEAWYDGVDQDCAGDDDYDADGDGYVPEDYAGLSDLPPGDCWDLPEALPAAFTVVGSDLTDKNGGTLDWAQPTAAEVNPDASDTWYDGVDQDCDGRDDFDQDGDGFRAEAYPDQAGVYGDDCIDGGALDDENIAGSLAAAVNPAATEVWYDGTDQDCDDNDCDKDGDGFDFDGSELCERQECDDDDPDAFPNDDPEWVWYDGQDNNCDGNEGDQDGDGYWVADYAERVAASGSGYDPRAIPTGMAGDCWDVPLDVEDAPTEYQALNGLPQPEAEDVYPGATDAYYDAVDQDCAGGDDFDQDGDGHQIDAYADRDGVTGDDCDDEDGSVFPGYFENWYDGTDQDCDGNDGDVDGDGYWDADYDSLVIGAGGTPLEIPEACGYDGLSSCAGDCDDGNDEVHPDRLEDCGTADDDDCDGDTNEDLLASEDAIDCTVFYLDQDRDGYGSIAGTDRCLCEPDSDRYYTTTDHADCDDTDATIYPGADEYCDGVDSDCDGTTDEDDATDAMTWYRDGDSDTFGDPGFSDVECYQPTGYVLDNTDCDDGRALSNPAATEYCNDHDDDCDGTVDEDDADDAPTWYRDVDSDGYGGSAVSLVQCYQPTGYVLDNTDCDDSDSGDYPGAPEIVGNEDDEDCDGVEVCYNDADNDGYLDTSGDTRASSDVDCADSYEGLASDPFTDCDDTDAGDHPGATEIVGNDDDEDCDGHEICYYDADDDGYLDTSGDTRTSTDTDCSDTYEGRSSDPFTDCDDSEDAVNPGVPELCDGLDNDCDGVVDGAGLVTFLSSAGAVSDLSAAYATGTSTAAYASSLSIDGTLSLCPGTYYVELTIRGADVTVAGLGGSGSTAILGDGTISVVTVASTCDSLALEGLTLEGGDALSGDGGGIYAGTHGVELVLDDVVVQDCHASSGGGIYQRGGSLAGTDLEVLDCTADDHGGGIYLYETTIDLASAIIEGNIAATQRGGGAYVDSCDVALDDVIFAENESSSYAGGAVFYDSTVTMESSSFERNVAYSAAGLMVLGGSADITSSDLVENVADDIGGGLYVTGGGAVAVTSTIISDNEAGEVGGGVFLNNSASLICYGTTAGTAGVYANTAGSLGGGAVLYDSGSTLTSSVCDWGAGSTANHPEDVVVYPVSASYGGYRFDESFTCSAIGCY